VRIAQKRAWYNIREKPTACEGCGRAVARLVRHHPDYRFPLMIVWVCHRCHAKIHADN
jgi:hypothetical protein